MGLLKMIWGGIVSLATLIVWPVAKLRGVSGIGQVVRWSLHFLFLGATLGLLWYINNAWELDKALRVPLAALRHAWLPLLFFLTYCTAWCAWWLWRLMMAEDRPSDFPDIDAAWHEATESLAKAGLNLTQLPLFLVVGRPAETEAAFFSATQLPFTHPQVPRDPNAPLHVHVSEEGIFVTCAGASLLGAQTALLTADRVWKREEPLVSKGRQANHLTSTATEDQANLPPIHEDDAYADDSNDGETLSPDGEFTTSSYKPSASSSQSSGTATLERPTVTSSKLSKGLSLVEEGIALLTDEERPVPDFVEDQMPNNKLEQDLNVDVSEVPLVKDLGEILGIQARLEHLCRLIAAAREPYCPLNGVAVLIPYGSSVSDRLANQMAALAQRDLETVQNTLGVRCPLVAIVCDLHEAPGCREMIQLFPEQQRHRRLGVRFPLVCNDPAANVSQMIDKGVRWVCRDLLPPLVYRLMKSADANSRSARNPSSANIRLYRFLDEIRQRELRLSRMMRQVFSAGNERNWLPAGCYLVANGTDMAREQGFAAGVLPQLFQMQNLLAWTPAAIASDKRHRRWVWIGYAALALCGGLIGLAIVRLF